MNSVSETKQNSPTWDCELFSGFRPKNIRYSNRYELGSGFCLAIYIYAIEYPPVDISHLLKSFPPPQMTSKTQAQQVREVKLQHWMVEEIWEQIWGPKQQTAAVRYQIHGSQKFRRKHRSSGRMGINCWGPGWPRKLTRGCMLIPFP